MKIISGFSEKLRNLRENAGLTQKQLAVQIGVSKSTMSQYELDERMPSPSSLVKIASVLHVSADYLLGIDNVKRADLSGLTEKDIEMVEMLIEHMREKNGK